MYNSKQNIHSELGIILSIFNIDEFIYNKKASKHVIGKTIWRNKCITSVQSWEHPNCVQHIYGLGIIIQWIGKNKYPLTSNGLED